MNHRRILAESKHYQVSHEFEIVFLTRKAGLFAAPQPETVIGDFYGNPTAAVIDGKERFVVVAGCGLIIYYFREPFEPYRYHVQTSQWIEMFRDKRAHWWIENLIQHNETTFHFVVDPNSREGGKYQLTLPDLTVQRLQ